LLFGTQAGQERKYDCVPWTHFGRRDPFVLTLQCHFPSSGYRSLAPIYFRNSAAAVIVYDVTQVCLCLPFTNANLSLSLCHLLQSAEASFDKAKNWVQTLKRQADPGIVIILVGNKIDLCAEDESKRRVPREVAEKYAKEEGLLFMEASAKTGEGVQELFVEVGELQGTCGEASS
jgi:Ras-related protein Rab-5C